MLARKEVAMNSEEKSVCELCGKETGSVIDYSENYAVQTAIASRLEQVTGEQLNVTPKSRLCDGCYEGLDIRDGELEE